MVIYHGSKDVILKPSYGCGNIHNDYGLGFYCTENIDLACEWACTESNNGYANKYDLNLNNLKILNLEDDKYNVLNWLAILLENRIINISTPTALKSKQFIIDNYLLDYKNYDIIIGYRADDSYFSFARAFITNQISLSQLEHSMRLGKLGIQVVLKTKKAFDQIQFIESTVALSSIYYEKKYNRDKKAKEEFNKELSRIDDQGIFIKDLMRGIK